MKDVIGLGALNVDLIYKVNDLSTFKSFQEVIPGAEITSNLEEFKFLLNILESEGKLVKKSGGGSAANTLFALSRMGFSAGFVGKAGRDVNGDFLLETLSPVDLSRVLRDKESGLCLCILDQSGERSILALPNCNNHLTFEEIDLDYLQKTKFLHLSSFRGDLPFEAQKRVAEIVYPKVRLSFDPGEIYARKGFKALLPLVKRSFIIFLSDKEAEILMGKSWIEACQELLTHGPKIVVCRRSDKGSHIFSLGEKIFVATERVKVTDKTGAGDVYAAGFLAGLLLNLPLYQCGVIATKAAVLSITGYGRDKYPDHQFLQETLAELS